MESLTQKHMKYLSENKNRNIHILFILYLSPSDMHVCVHTHTYTTKANYYKYNKRNGQVRVKCFYIIYLQN